MERVSEIKVRDRVRQANSKLREILSHARGALEGREDFTVQEIRALAEPLRDMERIVPRAAYLRAADVELGAELDDYAQTLEELETSLEQVRFMLLARQAHLVTAQGHLERVSLWTEALKQTQ